MKRKDVVSGGALIALALAVATTAIYAGLPQPLCILYGQACNEFGWPYQDNAEVVLRVGTTEYARCTINGSLSPGVNFALYVHLDDGSGDSAYCSWALHTGDTFEIVVRDQEGEKPILQTNQLPAVGQPGDIILINVTAGTDSDGDSLPDRWEETLIDCSDDPHLQTIQDVHPDDDSDGDGVSNLDEYRAGTFAFLDYDYFFAEQVAWNAGRLGIEFLSVAGKVYRLFLSTNLAENVWTPCPLALSPAGPLTNSLVEGDGDWLRLYVEPVKNPAVYRLSVQ